MRKEKKLIHLFFRKPSKNIHYSVENFYREIFKDFRDENIEIFSILKKEIDSEIL